MNAFDLDFPAHIWAPFAQGRPPIRCSPGYLIYLQGTEATCFYYLKEGQVRSFIQSEDGAERALNVYGPGSLDVYKRQPLPQPEHRPPYGSARYN